MEFRLLGPVEICVDGRVWEVGPPQQRQTFAALVADAGRPVTAEKLIDRVWDVAPPGARRALHVQITRIRRLLESAATPEQPPVRLVRRSGGYLLDVDTDAVDVHRFRRLLEAAAGASDHARTAPIVLLRQARALWRGEPLAGLTGEWAAQCRQGWREQYLDATVAWARAEIATGAPATVIGPLHDLAAQYPLMESLAAVLLQALCAVGRPAQALEHYASVRRRLAEELGADPSPELQAVHRAVLRGDPATRPGKPASVTVLPPVVPAQLPADLSSFVGRREQLALLDSLVADNPDPTSAGVRVCTVAGTAGIGKSTLVVHWAHTVADRFPDGQLYVNLRGFDPDGRATPAAEAVCGFLDGLGVSPQRLPAHPDAQVALYRSVIAGRRILVILDNARDAEQVRPLLPGTATAVTVVTSRNQLTGLVVTNGARSLTLDQLSRQHARELLRRRLGRQPLADEPDAVESIITACAGLPLALSIVAARAHQTGFPLPSLAAELGAADERLDHFDAGDPASRVRTVFSWSTSVLSEPSARLFRLLGLHPGADISAAAAANLAGRPASETYPILTELNRGGLLSEHVSGRYTFHDLLRAYAAELAHEFEPPGERRQATARLIDHYAHAAYAAARLLHPTDDPICLPLAPPAGGCRPEQPSDDQAAMIWFSAEHAVLLAVLRYAARAGFDAPTWQLAWSLHTYLHRQGRWHDRVAAWRIALEAAGRIEHLAAQAYAYRRLAIEYVQVGRYGDAEAKLQRSLQLYTDAEDRVGMARGHEVLAEVWGRQGDFERAVGHARRALNLSLAAGNAVGQANALNAIGLCQVGVGDHEQAITSCEHAVALYRRIGYRTGEAVALDSLGQAHQHAGRYAQALESYHHTLTLLRQLGSRQREADTLIRVGDTHHALGQPAAARAAWARAQSIFVSLDHPDGATAQARLHGSVGAAGRTTTLREPDENPVQVG